MKIAILASNDLSLLNFRGELIRLLVREGHQVLAFAPRRAPDIAARLDGVGAQFVETPLDPQGMNPFRDLAYRRGLEALFRHHAPDLLLAYTIKPVVHGCPAARAAGVPRVHALITGLGAAFNTGGLKGRLLAGIAARLYRAAFRACDSIIVQNPDMAQFFRTRGIIPPNGRLVVVPGSGVNLRHFTPEPLVPTPPRFLFLGRLLGDKGVREFGVAAREVKQIHPEAEFWLVGRADRNPAAMTPEELQQLQADGIVQHFDQVEDVRSFLRRCSVLVLPSYHEGMPRSVLEAMATGRPIITTDVIGCRETVFGLRSGTIGAHGVRLGANGLLVPVRSAPALAEAMNYLAEHPDTAREMGRAGRELAEVNFDVDKINGRMLDAMALSVAPASFPVHP